MRRALVAPVCALALAAPAAVVTTAPAAQGAGITFISFEDMSGTCYLSSSTPLRGRYAAAKFTGPGPQDGGAVLACADGGRTGSRYLAFNDDATMANGGSPVGPERIAFPDRQKRVTVWVSQADTDPGTATFRMVARRKGKVVRTTTATTETSDWVKLSIRHGKGIDNVRVNATTEPDGVWRLDDLTLKS